MYRTVQSDLSPSALAFFSNELRTAHTDTSVTVAGRSYRIQQGEAVPTDGGSLSSRERADALTLAYAQLLAQRRPALSLEGSNPDLMHEATLRLAAVTERLAALQETADASYLVGHSLYPIEFLYSLEKMERARQTFIVSGRDRDLSAYRTAQERAFAEGLRASQRFQKGLALMPSRSLPAAILGGKLSRDNMARTLFSITEGFRKIRVQARQQAACLAGTLAACTPLESSGTPTPPESAVRAGNSYTPVLTLVEEGFSRASTEESLVALEQSICIPGNKEADYLLAFHSGSKRIFTYFYVGDLYIQTLNTDERSAPVLSWFKKAGVTNLVYNPFTFYTCPSASADIARAKALLLIEERIASRPAGTPVLFESDAIRSLLAATDAADTSERSELRALYWSYENRTAGMEDIIYDVAHGLETVTTMYDKGIPTDVSADFLFSTHSGYYGLLLGHNRTARSGQPSPYEPDASNAFMKRFTLFSSVGDHVVLPDLLRDIQVYLRAHK